MTEPVTKRHVIEFTSYVKSAQHDEIARDVCSQISKCGPLLIRERELIIELERVRGEIKEYFSVMAFYRDGE